MQNSNIFCVCRREAGYTQSQLADLLGIDQTTVSKWENGIAYPHVALLLQFCRVVHTSPGHLFDGILLLEERRQANQLLPS